MKQTQEITALVDSLKRLSSLIKKNVSQALRTDTLEPEEESYLRWKVTKFQYTQNGLVDAPTTSEKFTKQSWHQATKEVLGSIEDSPVYLATLELLDGCLHQKAKACDYLHKFSRKLISECLLLSDISDSRVADLVGRFLKDIKDEPQKMGAKVELDGVVVLTDKVALAVGDTNIRLRRPTIEDLEKEFHPYELAMSSGFSRPSAILTIEFFGRHCGEIQLNVRRAVAILRLFKVGSVIDISYQMNSESITDIMATARITNSGMRHALEKSVIKDEDVEKLIAFWQTIDGILPGNFCSFEMTPLDHKVIAYIRYCDALLQNGAIERRFANAVMALEALFLDREPGELSYRLRMNVAKTVSLLGYDGDKARNAVKDAYGIRSTFVHGGHLSESSKQKLIKEHGDIQQFLLLILDYVRISILAMMFLDGTKKSFLALVGDSFFNRNKEKQLASRLAPARNIIGQ